MNDYLDKFLTLLELEQKEEAVAYTIDLLQSQKIDVITLYSHILAPALNEMQCSLQDKYLCVWKEHVRTAIVRTIVECCYPYVIKEREKQSIGKTGSVVIICPPEEYHDLGARMAADFFTICGYDVTFVGSNTPFMDFCNAVDMIKPNIIAISVSNYYNLVVTKKIIMKLRIKMHEHVKIIVGGYAFKQDPNNTKLVGADSCAQSFSDIKNIHNEVSV